MDDFLKKVSKMNIPQFNMWLAEAKFGYAHIKTYCDNLANGSNVLEIGSGSEYCYQCYLIDLSI